MVADRIPNPRREGSIPSTDAFARHLRMPTRTIDNWTFIAFFRQAPRPRRTFPAAPCVRRGRRPGASRANRPRDRTSRGRDQLWASGKATSFGLRATGVRVPPAGPGARRMLSYRPSGRHKRALRRKSAPHPAQGIPRPWLNRREHRSTKPGSAGSSPAGRAVSEAEVGDAPGRDPARGWPARAAVPPHVWSRAPPV